MKLYKVTKKDIVISYTYVTAEDWETAEDIAENLDSDEFEYCHGDTQIDVDEDYGHVVSWEGDE